MPGLENWPELTEKFGVTYMEDMTDSSGQSEADVEQALEYARIYNLLLFRTLRSNEVVTWDEYSRDARK